MSLPAVSELTLFRGFTLCGRHINTDYPEHRKEVHTTPCKVEALLSEQFRALWLPGASRGVRGKDLWMKISAQLSRFRVVSK